MVWIEQHSFGGTKLGVLAGIGHGDTIAQIAGQSDIVGNKYHRDSGILFEVLEQIHDLSLNADIERRGRFIEDEQIGVHYQCGGDDHALLLSAAQLVRIAIGDIRWKADSFEQLADALRRLLSVGISGGKQWFSDLKADAQDRIENTHRPLENHGDFSPADLPAKRVDVQRGQFLAIELNRTVEAGDVFRQHPHQGSGHAGFAAPRFSDDADSFATIFDCEGNAIDGMDRAISGTVVQVEIANGKQGHRRRQLRSVCWYGKRFSECRNRVG